MRLILWKLHVWRIDYCLAGKEESFQLPKRSYQGGTQQCSLVCVMDYLMTLVTKARVALTGNTGSTYKSACTACERPLLAKPNRWRVKFLEFPFKKCCLVHTNNVLLHGRCQKFSYPDFAQSCLSSDFCLFLVQYLLWKGLSEGLEGPAWKYIFMLWKMSDMISSHK